MAAVMQQVCQALWEHGLLRICKLPLQLQLEDLEVARRDWRRAKPAPKSYAWRRWQSTSEHRPSAAGCPHEGFGLVGPAMAFQSSISIWGGQFIAGKLLINGQPRAPSDFTAARGGWQPCATRHGTNEVRAWSHSVGAIVV